MSRLVKKKFLKETFSLILLLSVLFLSACGGGESAAPVTGTAAASTDAAAEAAVSAEETAAPAEYQPSGNTYDGEDFTIFSYKTDGYTWAAAAYCEVWTEGENGEPINDALYQRNRAVEEELGITISLYAADDKARTKSGEMLNKLVMAGDTTVDLVTMFIGAAKTCLVNGSFIDLNTLDGPDLDASWWNRSVTDELTFRGKTLGATGDFNLYSAFGLYQLFFNKAMIEDFSLDNPYEMVYNDTWYADKMIAMARSVTADIDGDGAMTQADRRGITGSRSLVMTSLVCSGGRMTGRNEKDEVVLTLQNERNFAILDKWGNFWMDRDTVLSSGDFSGYSNAFYELLIPTFKDGRALFLFNQLLVSFELREMEIDYGLLPFPKFDEAQEDFCNDLSTSWITFTAVPVTSARSALCADAMNALGYYSQQLVTPSFIDTTIKFKASRDEDSTRMMDIILDGRVFDIQAMFDFGGIYKAMYSLPAAGSMDYASTYASLETKAQTEIASFMESLEG